MKTYFKQSISQIIDDSLPEPILELTEERIEKLKNTAEVIMGVLSIATILTMTVVAPNAIQALKLFQKRKGKKFSTKQNKQKILKSFYYLRSKGYIEFKARGKDYELLLTDKGKKQIKNLNFDTLSIAAPATWDGKFWQIAIDIPVKYKTAADYLRTKLKELNCYPLQRSLWFYPHDPRGEIEFVARTYGVANYLTFMKIERMEQDDESMLREYFRSLSII
ncbi:MAG: hypothetical protein A2751_01375 [Candidatus Doudnabacteria bacterium RIFCSPHIGHO2_01_FULL_46_14]|uniref:Transcriptional repressor PaaX-like central Cas2-like domain-containing protein n=1 Tax=Candidatus Doudnabacteria bacterium RIFCSPHIGHO2_01_FULL_46_14 TaxID=1817824 RepID=A0A1F5NMA0_9BACT|nr:MAG: hypothetical protein A2751_01375 [Candidatus Doudnabacteria bacterium RIFCSPHIGHO2_01_FULL_46_14]